MKRPPEASSQTNCNRIGKLILSAFVLATLTFVVMPLAAQFQTVKERINWLEKQQIDGGATFYTDHEFLETLLLQRES